MLESRFGPEYDRWIEAMRRAGAWETTFADANYYNRLRRAIGELEEACERLRRHLNFEDPHSA